MTIALYTCRRLIIPMPHVDDARADNAESRLVAFASIFSRWWSHRSRVSIWMPRYRHDGEAMIVAPGKRRGCVLFILGSLVKCTNSYFAGANWEPCLLAHSSAFRWMILRVLQLHCDVGPTARIDASSMYPTASVSSVLHASIRSAL